MAISTALKNRIPNRLVDYLLFPVRLEQPVFCWEAPLSVRSRTQVMQSSAHSASRSSECEALQVIEDRDREMPVGESVDSSETETNSTGSYLPAHPDSQFSQLSSVRSDVSQVPIRKTYSEAEYRLNQVRHI